MNLPYITNKEMDGKFFIDKTELVRLFNDHQEKLEKNRKLIGLNSTKKEYPYIKQSINKDDIIGVKRLTPLICGPKINNYTNKYFINILYRTQDGTGYLNIPYNEEDIE